MTRRAFAMGFTALALAGGAGGWLALSRQLSHTTPGTNVSTDANNVIGTPDAKGDRVLIYKAHPARVTSVAWSPDGKRIASASDDKLVTICDSSNGTTSPYLSWTCGGGIRRGMVARWQIYCFGWRG